MSNVTEPCCVCGDTNSTACREIAYPEYGLPDNFCLRRCNKCGLLFNFPRIDDCSLGDLYDKNYYFFNRPDAPEFARVAPTYARTVALVAGNFELGGKPRCLLDVGCGRGYFPAILKRLGWEAHAVEISPEAADYARSRLGLSKVFVGTIEQFSKTQTLQFPLVTAIDVIEHVPSPRTFVESLSSVVAPGGILVIDTPNADAFNIGIERSSWIGFNPFHIFLFNRKNLARILEDYGFAVETAFSYSNSKSNLRRRIRSIAIGALKSLGVIGAASRVFFARRSRQSDAPLDVSIAATLGSIREGPTYFQTQDAEGPLASALLGDNIVLIARKS